MRARSLLLFAVAAASAALVASCGRPRGDDGAGAPSRSAAVRPTPSIDPDLFFARPTATPSGQPAPTRRRAATPAPDGKLIVITEEDLLRAIMNGLPAERGASVDGLTLSFEDGKVVIGADSLRYSLVSVRNLSLVGRLEAENGRLRLVVESVSPRGLVTSRISSLANQALARYTSRWTIEEVRTLDGRLELRIR